MWTTHRRSRWIGHDSGVGEQVVLARQGGLITHAQALACGMSRATISRRVRTRHWFRVLPGVYRHAAAPVGSDLMARATLMWAGPHAVLSGPWAAWWHGLAPEPIGPVSVTVPPTSGLRSRRNVQVRRRFVESADVTVVRGMRLVSRALSALECASGSDGQDIVDRAAQRHVTSDEFSLALTRFRYARGAQAARTTIALLQDGAVSPPERELLRALRSAGLTDLRAGVKIRIDGRLLWLDLAVPELKLAVEVDGVAVHSDVSQIHDDLARQNMLMTAGWTVLRYTPKQIRQDLDAIVEQIRVTLAHLSHI